MRNSIMGMVDEIYKDGNVAIPPPKMLNQRSEPTKLEEAYNKTNKEVGLLNKQYNKLLIESNTLRKRIAYYENKLRQVDNDNNKLSISNGKLRDRVDTLEDNIIAIKNKLGL